MDHPDLLVLGDVNPDVVVRGPGVRVRFRQQEQIVDAIDVTIGGSAAIVAAGASRLGLRVSIVGAVGDDSLGRLTLEALAERGVDVSHCPIIAGVPTGASVILSDLDDRAILTARGTIPMLTMTHIPSLEGVRHVHVASYYLLDGLRESVAGIFDRVHVAGGTTSLDVNWDPSGAWETGLDDALARTDVFLPNRAEAVELTGFSEPEAAADDLLARGAKVVAIKLGARGGLAMSRTSGPLRVPAVDVRAVDTTGAGDSFDAGFLAGWMPTGSLERGLELAVASGSLSTRAAGGTAAQPTLDEIRAAMPRSTGSIVGSVRE